MMKNKIKVLLFLLLVTLVFPTSYAAISNRPLNEISLKPIEDKIIRSGDINKYILEVKDDRGNYLNGSYSLDLFNNTSNQKINLIPRENFYYFKEGKIQISFSLFKAGMNEIIINADNGRGKKKVEIFVESSLEAYSSGSLTDLEYSFLETVTPIKKGNNRIRIYLKDSLGNEIKEGKYSFNILSEILDSDGRIKENYFIQDELLIDSSYISVTGDIIKEKGYIEMILKVPEEMDKNDGITLSFYLESGIRLNPYLSYFAKDEANYQKTENTGLKNELVLQIGSNKAKVNNFVVFIDTQPRLINNVTMVPLRIVSDFLGIKAEWISEKNGVLLIGKGKEIFLENPSTIIQGRTYVPLRYIGEEFDSLVIWDGVERKIIIKN